MSPVVNYLDENNQKPAHCVEFKIDPSAQCDAYSGNAMTDKNGGWLLRGARYKRTLGIKLGTAAERPLKVQSGAK